MALKGHRMCVCGIGGTNRCHPSAAAHEQDLQSYATMPLCHSPPRSDSSYTSLPIPGRPEDSSSSRTLIPGFWAAAGGIGVVTPLAYLVLHPVLLFMKDIN